MDKRKVIPVWKPIGWTPLEAIEEFKKLEPSYSEDIISYAGRLDPMAEGVLILLVGQENKKRKEYEDLKKEYESEIIFGFITDSFDAMGLVEKVNPSDNISMKKIETALKKFTGKNKQKYPPYSSKAVNGKPLYWWARQNKLSEIEIPQREIEIYAIDLIESLEISLKHIVENIKQNISKVKGDFRQEEILKRWEDVLNENQKLKVLKIKIIVSCSSGTYVRRLASDIGEELGVGAFCLSITRLKAGDFEKKDCYLFESVTRSIIS